MFNRNILKNFIIISIIILNSVLIYSSMKGNASTQAITMDIELESQQYKIMHNITHYYSNFSFSLKSLKHYIFISSVNGNLTLENDKNKILPLNSINHPPAIGLEPLEKVFIKFSSQYSTESFMRENITINLYVNFQLVVTSEANLRKIVTRPAIFNSSVYKIEVIVPSGSVYFSTNYTDETESSSLNYKFDVIFMTVIVLLIVLRSKKDKS